MVSRFLSFLLFGLIVLAALSIDLNARGSINSTKSSVYSDSIYVDGGSHRLAPIRYRLRARKDPDWDRALKIHYNALIVDGHVDTPTLVIQQDYNIGEWHAGASVDLPRMNAGGLDAAFFAIFTPVFSGDGSGAFDFVLDGVNKTKKQVESNSNFGQIALTSEDILSLSRSEKKSVILALEGGHLLAGDLSRIQDLYDAGVRYVTLTHNRSHSWSDSALDISRWNGISDIGDKIIREMNRVGMIIDVSHSSEEVIEDVLAVTTSPIIASHSSSRALVDNPRNLSDKAIVAIANSGGIVMINFYDMLINTSLDAEVMKNAMDNVRTYHEGNLRMIYRSSFQQKISRGLREANIDDIVDHIQHVVNLVGIDHVGIGSDFDGAPGPVGLEQVSQLPELTYKLVTRGFSDEEIYKILGSNLISVMKRVEDSRFK